MQIVSLLHMMKERHFGRASEENFIVWGMYVCESDCYEWTKIAVIKLKRCPGVRAT